MSYLKGHYNADRPGRVSDWNDTANGVEARAKATELPRATHTSHSGTRLKTEIVPANGYTYINMYIFMY